MARGGHPRPLDRGMLLCVPRDVARKVDGDWIPYASPAAHEGAGLRWPPPSSNPGSGAPGATSRPRARDGLLSLAPAKIVVACKFSPQISHFNQGLSGGGGNGNSIRDRSVPSNLASRAERGREGNECSSRSGAPKNREGHGVCICSIGGVGAGLGPSLGPLGASDITNAQ